MTSIGDGEFYDRLCRVLWMDGYQIRLFKSDENDNRASGLWFGSLKLIIIADCLSIQGKAETLAHEFGHKILNHSGDRYYGRIESAEREAEIFAWHMIERLVGKPVSVSKSRKIDNAAKLYIPTIVDMVIDKMMDDKIFEPIKPKNKYRIKNIDKDKIRITWQEEGVKREVVIDVSNSINSAKQYEILNGYKKCLTIGEICLSYWSDNEGWVDL